MEKKNILPQVIAPALLWSAPDNLCFSDPDSVCVDPNNILKNTVKHIN